MDRRGNVYVADSTNARVRKVSPGGSISTFAGTGMPGFFGDGGPATSAKLNFPEGVAVDRKGNVYIADYANSRVRKVSRGGTITTIAGTGKVGGDSGNGGPATKARLDGSTDVAVDGNGNVYIVESNPDYDGDPRSGIVRKVNRRGTITRFAGTGRTGLGVSGDGGPATSSQFRWVGGVAVDGQGNVYIAADVRVRKVNHAGTITTFAGTDAAGFSGDGGPATSARLGGPHGVAVDGKGNVYIADYQRVRKVSRGGTITTIAGTGKYGFSGDGGLATSARLYNPYGVAVDGRGNVYIADHLNSRVRKVSTGPAPVVSGRCSKATALEVATPLNLVDTVLTNPIAGVLCGAFAGPESQVMVARSRGAHACRTADGRS